MSELEERINELELENEELRNEIEDLKYRFVDLVDRAINFWKIVREDIQADIQALPVPDAVPDGTETAKNIESLISEDLNRFKGSK